MANVEVVKSQNCSNGGRGSSTRTISEGADWIVRVEEQLLNRKNEILLRERRCMFFSVPKPLVDTFECFYIPNFVSIGPHHFANPNLRRMESHKIEAICRMESRILKIYPQRTLKSIVEGEIMAKEKWIRDCYEDEISYSPIELAWIVTEECVYQHCKIGSAFIPELNGKFFATENFCYTSQFFGLVQKASLSDIKKAGKHYCGEDWAVLQEKHRDLEKEDLLKYCFSAAYIVAFLNDSLGIAMNDERIRFTNQVGTVPIDWALGAFILRTIEDLPSDQPSWILGEDSFTFFSLIAILVLLGLQHGPYQDGENYMTIYDLEKGRYITSAARV